ncbi:MAG: PD-(D/E)XK nuclease-like domain-containing protein [Desulfovibrio sp.]|nr:PD-(D/E)XK nuclease-like domain-containing protein [Desulfovibrio sp.]
MQEIIYDQTAQDYRRAEGLNKSSIDKLLKCPAEWHELQMLPPVEPTPAMRFGTALHSYILGTPEDFQREVCVLSKPATTKEGKAMKREAEDAGKVCISVDDYERIFRMGLHMHNHPRICALLPPPPPQLLDNDERPRLAKRRVNSLPGDSEVSIYWEREVEGQPIQCKARIDRLCRLPDGSVIAMDVKTTSGGLDRDSIAKHIAQYGYHRQAAWYTSGLSALGLSVQAFIFVFTSTAAPFLCVPVQIDAEGEALGLEECRIAAEAYASGLQSDAWPTYSEDIYEISLPGWCFSRSQAKLPTMWD